MEYGEKYFNWQKTVGEFGGKANLFKFEDYIRHDDIVLDFGCGGGYLLENIQTTGEKIGIEINPVARELVQQKEMKCYESISEIPDKYVDVIISNHALEHVENPAEILREFKRVLKVGGLAIVVVPHESSKTVNLEDHNMHLFTWSPQTLVNLFKSCDFGIFSYDSICHMWMPHYQFIQRVFGWKIFHILCKIYCKIKGTGYQTRVVGIVNEE